MKTLTKLIEKELENLKEYYLEQDNILKEQNNLLETFNKSFSDLDTDILLKYKLITEEEIANFIFISYLHKKALIDKKNVFLILTKEQQDLLENIKNKILSNIDKINENLSNKTKENSYKKILEKIKSNELFTTSDLDYLNTFIQDNKVEEETKYKIIKEVILYNYKHQRKEDITIIKDEGISKEDLSTLFEEYSIVFPKNAKKYYDEILQYGNLEEIKEKLKLLKDKNLLFIFNKPELLKNILIHSDINKLEKLFEFFLKKGMLDEQYLSKTPEIFYSIYSNGTLDSAISNLELLEKLGIDIKQKFASCITFLSGSVEVHKNNYNGFKLYGLEEKIKKSLYCLNRKYILSKLDTAIESGCAKYVTNCLSTLNSISYNFYLIKYCKKKYPELALFKYSERFGTTLSAEVTKKAKERFKEVYINTNNGLVLSEDLMFKNYGAVKPSENQVELVNYLNNVDAYSIDDSIFENTYIKALEQEFKESDLIYNINGVLISRIKVLRYATALKKDNVSLNYEMILCTILKGTMLDELELERLNKGLERVKGVQYDRRSRKTWN